MEYRFSLSLSALFASCIPGECTCWIQRVLPPSAQAQVRNLRPPTLRKHAVPFFPLSPTSTHLPAPPTLSQRMVAAAPAPDRPPLAGVESILADRLLQLHPAPEEFPTAQLGAAGVPEEEAGETSPLLGRKRSARSRSTERRRGKPWWRRPSPLWCVCLLAELGGES